MQTNRDGEALSLLRLVHIGIIVSLFWKARFYWYSLGVNQEFPLVDPFFPELFRSQAVLVAAWILATACSLLTLVVKGKHWLLPLGVGSCLGLSILSVHQNSYNDVTFVCCAWTSLWCLWYGSRIGERFETLYPRTAWFSHVILSLIFFGAAGWQANAGLLVR